MPARNTKNIAGHIVADRDTDITLEVRADRTGWQNGASLRVTVTGPDNEVVVDCTCRQDTANARGRVANAGTHAVTVSGTNLPNNGSTFEVDITYTAPREI